MAFSYELFVKGGYCCPNQEKTKTLAPLCIIDSDVGVEGAQRMDYSLLMLSVSFQILLDMAPEPRGMLQKQKRCEPRQKMVASKIAAQII